jgi:hypothetical protein
VFSPHNQQIVGNLIYLSGYHSGVTVLDATEAFRGRNVRPKEVGVSVTPAPQTRPIHPDRATSSPLFDQFFTSFIKYRPTIWDMQYHRGQVLAADMVGGFYSLRLTGELGQTARAFEAAQERAATQRGGSRTTRTCLSRRALRITLRDPRGRERIRSVRVLVNGKRQVTLRGRHLARVKRGARFRVPVTLRGRRVGRYRVRILARTSRGRTMRISRMYRTCIPRGR